MSVATTSLGLVRFRLCRRQFARRRIAHGSAGIDFGLNLYFAGAGKFERNRQNIAALQIVMQFPQLDRDDSEGLTFEEFRDGVRMLSSLMRAAHDGAAAELARLRQENAALRGHLDRLMSAEARARAISSSEGDEQPKREALSSVRWRAARILSSSDANVV